MRIYYVYRDHIEIVSPYSLLRTRKSCEASNFFFLVVVRVTPFLLSAGEAQTWLQELFDVLGWQLLRRGLIY